MKKKLFLIVFLTVLFCGSSLVFAESVRRGAKVVKADRTETKAPEIKVPDGWKLCEGEKFTGVNIREYYFTLESEKKTAEDPEVQITWPNVKIAKVYGGTDIRDSKEGVRFKVTSKKAPTSFTTLLPRRGVVSMAIFHNIEGMQAGSYRGIPYPKDQIAAQLNYLFAAGEMMREAGFTDSEKSLDGIINLYGFETNFPNGHVDCPPHFHIMTMWDNWAWDQATHFILAENGKILRNDLFVVEDGKTNDKKCRLFNPDEEVSLSDKSGKIRFTLRILVDGTGIDMKVPGQKRQFRIASGNAPESVSCYTRENESAPWKLVSTSRVEDDSIHGVLTVVTERKADAAPITEIWRYNPDTGALIK